MLNVGYPNIICSRLVGIMKVPTENGPIILKLSGVGWWIGVWQVYRQKFEVQCEQSSLWCEVMVYYIWRQRKPIIHGANSKVKRFLCI